MFQTNHGSLKGKTVLITGSTSGIGESIARSFHAQGSKVAILDYNAEPGQALAKELGERVNFQHNDVRDIPPRYTAIRRGSDAINPITTPINDTARDGLHTIDQVTPEY
jgi:D-xylose 1-dehydrogenase